MYIKETKCAVESYSCLITKLLPLKTVKMLFESLHTYLTVISSMKNFSIKLILNVYAM